MKAMSNVSRSRVIGMPIALIASKKPSASSASSCASSPGARARVVEPAELLLVAGVAQAEGQVELVGRVPDHVAERGVGGGLEACSGTARSRLWPSSVTGMPNICASSVVKPNRLPSGVGATPRLRTMLSTVVGVGIDLAGLLGVLLEVADAGDPVDALVAAAELELLVEALVALGVGRVDVEVEAVGAVLLDLVERVVLAPGRGRGQVAPAEGVVDDQRDAVEGAPFRAAIGVAEGRHVERVEVVGRIGRAPAAGPAPAAARTMPVVGAAVLVEAPRGPSSASAVVLSPMRTCQPARVAQ